VKKPVLVHDKLGRVIAAGQQFTPVAAGAPIKLARLYRAHVTPVDWRGAERTAFVEAYSHSDAVRKIAAAVAALEQRSPVAVEERVYNCYSSEELVDGGLSDSPELRLFEIGWSDGRATHFVTEPLFLLDQPAELCRLWASIRAPTE
jgi:hypothetical protein